MKEIVLEVLERYDGKQWNLDAPAARESIADEVADAVQQVYQLTDTRRRVWSEKDMWKDENVWGLSKDDNGGDRN